MKKTSILWNTLQKDTMAGLKAEISDLKLTVHQAGPALPRKPGTVRTVFEELRLGNKIISSYLKILQLNQAMVELLGFENKSEFIGAAIFIHRRNVIKIKPGKTLMSLTFCQFDDPV